MIRILLTKCDRERPVCNIKRMQLRRQGTVESYVLLENSTVRHESIQGSTRLIFYLFIYLFFTTQNLDN